MRNVTTARHPEFISGSRKSQINKDINIDRIKIPAFAGMTWGQIAISPVSVCRMAIVLVVMMVFSSCEKYLDIKSTNTQAPITTIAECQELLNGLGMNQGYPMESLLSAEEFYLNAEDYNSENVQINDRLLYTWSNSAYGGGWGPCYSRVYLSNVVMESLEKIAKKENVNMAVYNNIKGQALFFRAMAFWQLAQIYTKPYSTASAGQDPGIPLRLISDINDKSVRGTVQQTYDRIVQDLQESVALLESSFVVPTRPTKTAAYAMLARVYLGMEDYPNALNNATEALKLNSQLVDFNTLDKDSKTPFARYNPEMIFYAVSDQTKIMNPNDFARIDLSLISLYGENDLRKQVFFNDNMMSVPDGTVDEPDRTKEVPDGTYRFTGNYEPNADDAILFVGLAVDEMLLIRAECHARAGNAASAMADVNTLLVSRWNTNDGATPYVAMTASSEDDALRKVILERRKELVFRGTRWQDLRRLNKDPRFAQTLTRTALGQTYTLPPNDPRYVLLIPIDAVNRGGIAQNER